VALSLPSLRVRTLSGALAAQIRRVRKTGFTLAPEAATARLRAVINKDLTEDDVLAAADTAFSLGWRTLKLYFMVGLPTETDDDLASVATLSGKIAKARRAKLNLGVAHFTPKAHTPFQWHPGSEPALIEKRLGLIKSAARVPGITVKYNDAGVSFVEALLSRGDRRLGPLLAEVHRRGGRFEAWNDHFSLDRWLKAMDDLKLDLKEFLRARETDEVLPWDHLFCGPSKPFLLKELARSEAALTTPDCRWAGCLGCGACHDGATVDLAEPAVAEPGTTTRSERDAKLGQAPVGAGRETAGRRAAAATGRPPLTFRFMGRFSKDGAMALLGHLETAELFKRAFRRAGLKLAMSEGFHPQPKLSFLTALPLGVPSLDERFTFGLERPASPALIMDQMELPEGLKLLDVTALSPESAKPRATAGLWLVRTPDPVFTGPPLHPTAHLRYTDHKSGPRDFALADFVTEVSVLDPHSCRLLVRMGQNGTPKPLAAARLMWDLEPDHPASLFKLATILDRDPS
jgi:radical SAM-linked protein